MESFVFWAYSNVSTLTLLFTYEIHFQLPLFSNIVNRATVNCARITGFDEKTCGSVIHEVNRILAPPTKNILEVINSDQKYSTLRQVLKDTEVEKILQQNNQSITFLAPTDETFSTLDDKDKKTLLNDKDKANLVLKNHVLTGKEGYLTTTFSISIYYI